MNPTNRPLSPHLQIYRLPLVALMSITHRITGVALSAGTILLVVWLGSAAYGPEAYDQVSACLASPFGMIVLFGFSAAFYFHLCNGIRHLVWDAGRGFELATVARSNRLVLLGAVVLTAATWAYALLHH
ncbi:MAG TPA: succinate dehydrogenase, cytochrome b556 subunit [Magnetospirillaceae bacterium]|nr:succinate dehydrogenase, cytochrome b556 subunit [Magnetospirillaceae bacterium]